MKQGEKLIELKHPGYSTLNPSDLGIENFIDNLKTEFERQSNLLIDNIIDDL